MADCTSVPQVSESPVATAAVTLAELIAATEAAWTALGAINRLQDTLSPNTPEEDAEYDAVNGAHMAAVEAVRDCEPQDWVEFTAKALLLRSPAGNSEGEGDENLEVLAEDAKRLNDGPSSARQTPAPTTTPATEATPLSPRSPRSPNRAAILARLTDAAPWLGAKYLAKLAAEHEAQLVKERGLYAELAAGLRPISTALADHAQRAADQDFPFDVYLEHLEAWLARPTHEHHDGLPGLITAAEAAWAAVVAIEARIDGVSPGTPQWDEEKPAYSAACQAHGAAESAVVAARPQSWSEYRTKLAFLRGDASGTGGENEEIANGLAALVDDALWLSANQPPPSDGPSAWDAGYAAYMAARAEADAAEAVLDEQMDRGRAEAPPCPPEMKGPRGGVLYTTEGSIIDDARLTFDEKARLVPIFREWRRAEDDSTRRYVTAEARERLAAAEDAWTAAEAALWETPAVTPEAFAQKFRLFMTETYLVCADKYLTAVMVERLSDEEQDAHVPVCIGLFQDALRMAGHEGPELRVEPFDVAAWIDQFEAYPGHTVEDIGPVFQEPEAWGQDALSYDDFLITDPTAIANYKAWEKDKMREETWAAQLRMHPGYETSPFRVAQREAIEAAFEHDREKRDHLLAMWERWADQKANGQPLGRHLWSELQPWQKKLVTAAARTRHSVIRHIKLNLDAEQWVTEYEFAGGTVSATGSDLWIGEPLGTADHGQPYMRRSLRQALEQERYLRDRVLAFVLKGQGGDAEFDTAPRAEVGMAVAS